MFGHMLGEYLVHLWTKDCIHTYLSLGYRELQKKISGRCNLPRVGARCNTLWGTLQHGLTLTKINDRQL